MTHPLQDSEMKEELYKNFAPIVKKLNLREETVSGVDEIGMVINFIFEVLSSEKEKWIRGEREKVPQMKQEVIVAYYEGTDIPDPDKSVLLKENIGYNNATKDQLSHLQQQLDLLTKE